MGETGTPIKRRQGCLWWPGRVVVGTILLFLLVNLAGFVYETLASKSDMQRYPPPGKQVDIGGYRLHLYCSGQRREGEPTVVLEAGHGLGGAAWELVQPQVAGFARVCSYDRAGYVWSDAGPLPRTSRQIATELHALLLAAGESAPYVLVGHSFGGHTVRLYADEHPGDVVGAVLVDVRLADIRDPVLKQESEASSNLLPTLMALGSRFGVPRLATGPMRSATGLGRLPDYPIVLSMNAKHMGAAEDESRAMAESDAQVQAAGSLGDMPLIVLRHGVPGMWKSEQAEHAFQQELAELASLSTNGRSIVAEESGHLVMVDQPEVVIDAVRQVLQAASPWSAPGGEPGQDLASAIPASERRQREMSGFLLGLANGTSCLVFCAPVLIPYLLSKGDNVRHNLATLVKFLSGRLGGYLLFGLLAWAVGGLLLEAGGLQPLLIGGTYVGLSVLLLVAVFRKKRPTPGVCALSQAQARFRRWPALLPVGMGLLAGLKLCPPILLAFTDAAGSGTLGDSLLLFLTFFLGTSLYFLPISLLGAFSRVPDLRIVGKFAAAIVALYYFFSGILLVAGGVRL